MMGKHTGCRDKELYIPGIGEQLQIIQFMLGMHIFLRKTFIDTN